VLLDSFFFFFCIICFFSEKKNSFFFEIEYFIGIFGTGLTFESLERVTTSGECQQAV
jgi:hypothetical protein